MRVFAATVLVWMAAAAAFAQPGFLSGFVIDEAGEPVNGATIRVTTHGGGPQRLHFTTAEDGRFLLIVRQSDNWDFTVEAVGFAPLSGTVRVRFGVRQPALLVHLARRETPELWGVLAGAKPAQISAQLIAADALLHSGRYDEAIEAYEDIRRQTPALSAVGLQVGRAYLNKGDYGRAENELTAVLASGAARAAACHDLGDVKAAQDMADEAAGWYRKSAEADPLWTRPLMRLAEIAHNRGDRQTAAAQLRKVVDLDPACPDGVRAAALLKIWAE